MNYPKCYGDFYECPHEEGYENCWCNVSCEEETIEIQEKSDE